MQAIGNGTYGVYSGSSTYYYVTVSTQGNASSFGSVSAAAVNGISGSGGAGDGTYGIFTDRSNKK